MPQRITPRALMEGALVGALTTVLGILGVYFPLIGPLFPLIWPLPIIIITKRQGLKMSFLSLIVSSLLMVAFLGPLQAAGIVSGTALAGLVMGWGLRKEFKFTWNIILGTLAMVLSLLGVTAIYFMVLHINPINDAFNMMQKLVGEMVNSYKAMGMDKAQIEKTRNMLVQALETAKLMIPSALAAGSIFVSFINLHFARVILRRLGEDTAETLPFIKWRFPGIFSWFLIMGIIIGVYGQTYNYSVLTAVGFNLMFFFSVLFFIQGLSVIFYFLEPHGLPTFVKVMIGIFLWFLSSLIALPIINFVGLFDCWFDYRRLRPKEESE